MSHKHNKEITMTKEEAMSVIEHRLLPAMDIVKWKEALNVALFVMRGQDWIGKDNTDEELKMLKEYKELASELMEEQTKAIKLRDEIIALRDSQIKEMRTLIDI